jgi:hypothetical protein
VRHPFIRGLARANRHGPLIVVIAVFAGSRALVYALGVRFDTTPIDYFQQLVDPELLRTRLVESLFYLHSQPPLFNLLIGVGLKLFPDHFDTAMHTFYLGLGLVQSLATYVLLVRLGVRRWTSTGVAVALSVTPATLLYENWLFYEYPVATLLIASALALHEFVRRATVWPGAAFFTLLAAVVYLRSIFQVVWLALVVCLIVLVRRDLARTALFGALPLLAVVLLITKNVVVFGVPTTSSWFGMNFAQVLYSEVPLVERRDLVARGELSRVSSIDPFRPPEDYASVVSIPPPRGIPVLDRMEKSSGAPNWNHLLLVSVSRDYFEDSIRLIRLRPRAYPAAILEGGKLYFHPATDSDFIAKNRDQIRGYVKLFDRIVLLRTGFSQIALMLVLAHVVALLYGLVRTSRIIRRRVEATPEAVTVAYLWVTLVYVTAVITFTQVSENNRIRFFLDPLVVILLASGFRDLFRRFRRSTVVADQVAG